MKDCLQYIYFLLFILCSEARIGFLQVKSNADSNPVEFCLAYNGDVNSFPIGAQTLKWDNWHQVADIYPDYHCNLTTEDYNGQYVFVNRGNCTFSSKALNVQQANGQGVLVVSDKGLDTPAVDADIIPSINITLGVITEKSYQAILNLEKNHKVRSVRVMVYTLVMQSASFDPSSIVMWLIAVITLAYGAWYQGALTRKSFSTMSVTKQVPPPSCEANVSSPAKKTEQSISTSSKLSNKSILDFTITPGLIIIFFIMCSVSLLLLYFFYDYLVYIIIGIFCYASSLSLFDFLSNIFEQSACFKRHRIPANKIPFLKSRPSIYSIALFFACAGFGIVWVVYRNENFAWVLQDILGFSFCVLMIKTIKISSYKISTVLLMLFFVYDVFYVFITPLFTKDNVSIMVEVATGSGSKTMEELPMLFKLPKFINSPLLKCLSRDYSLLGYGDVILPGLHVGFCAIWDVMRSRHKSVKSYVYYVFGVVGYGLGLTVTFIAVYVMEMGQPALLYLAPFCLLSTLFVALKQKEVSDIWDGKYKAIDPPADVRPDESHSLLEVRQQ